MKTKYRITSDGSIQYLWYLKHKKFLWLIPYKAWTRVWYPCYSNLRSNTYYMPNWRFSHLNGLDEYITSCILDELGFSNLKKFILVYPNIEDYFKWAFDEVEKMRLQSVEYKKKLIKKAESEYYESN